MYTSKINFLILFLLIGAFVFAQEKVDQNMMAKIREEGLQKSQIMDIALHLTDLNGNRLANSPGYTRAANYAKSKLTEWGVQNAQLDPWGEFGKGWELEKMYLLFERIGIRRILDKDRISHRQQGCFQIRFLLLR